MSISDMTVSTMMYTFEALLQGAERVTARRNHCKSDPVQIQSQIGKETDEEKHGGTVSRCATGEGSLIHNLSRVAEKESAKRWTATGCVTRPADEAPQGAAKTTSCGRATFLDREAAIARVPRVSVPCPSAFPFDRPHVSE